MIPPVMKFRKLTHKLQTFRIILWRLLAELGVEKVSLMEGRNIDSERTFIPLAQHTLHRTHGAAFRAAGFAFRRCTLRRCIRETEFY